GCTDADTIPKPPWKQRKQQYLDHLEDASVSILRVSIADKLHNSRSVVADREILGEEVWKKFTGGRDGTIWYYESLAEIFHRRLPAPKAAEFSQNVAAIKK